MDAQGRITVIGAGVSGLTTAVVLQERGYAVRVIAREIPGATSLAAGALWGPYLVEPWDRVRAWSQRSLEVFRELASRNVPGVRITSGIEASRTVEPPPPWSTLLPEFRPCSPDDLPSGFASGYRFTVPLIDMPAYLAYLLERLESAGGTIEQHEVASLEELSTEAAVVNCSGLGAAKLADDTGLRPTLGQHVVVENPGLTEFFSEDTGLSPDLLCIYPHGETVVLGGSAIDGQQDAEPGEADRIVARCAAVEPRLLNARIIGCRTGLRPTRAEVRVDAETHAGSLRVHNYGHGGAGVTLSWGCADEVHRILAASR